jgi:hypothetical protein
MTNLMSDEAFQLIIGECTHPDFSFIFNGNVSVPYLQVEFKAPCSKTGKVESWKGRKWQLSRYMTKGEIVQTCFKAILTAVEHEVRENFRVKGAMVFNPHLDIDRLVGLASDPRSIVERQ